MSSSGAMVDTPFDLLSGTTISLIRGSLSVEGTVMWSSHGRCGIRFVTEVTVREWLAPGGGTEQQGVDALVTLLKSNSQKVRTGAITTFAEDSTPSSLDLLVQDLGMASALVQALTDDLASSSEIIEQHGQKLQYLDLVVQTLQAVSVELASYPLKSTVSGATLTGLRVVLARALKNCEE